MPAVRRPATGREGLRDTRWVRADPSRIPIRWIYYFTSSIDSSCSRLSSWRSLLGHLFRRHVPLTARLINARLSGGDKTRARRGEGIHRECGAVHQVFSHPSANLWGNMSAPVATIDEPAYVKLMLHAAKYPWAAVSGFLLGEGVSRDQVSAVRVADLGRA